MKHLLLAYLCLSGTLAHTQEYTSITLESLLTPPSETASPDETPAPAAAAATAAPIIAPAPATPIVVTPDDAQTEAGVEDQAVVRFSTSSVNYSPYAVFRSLRPEPRPAGLAERRASSDPRLSAREECYAELLIASAKDHVRDEYNNRPRSGGRCGVGTRHSIQYAGFYAGGTLGAGAIDWEALGSLRRLGFRNIYRPGMTADDAPPGAVLVFSGPRSEEYIANRSAFPVSSLTGHIVGHVTIKGDDGWWYTDARTDEAAVANRTLEAVYVMSGCPECTDEVRNQCNGLSNNR